MPYKQGKTLNFAAAISLSGEQGLLPEMDCWNIIKKYKCATQRKFNAYSTAGLRKKIYLL